MIAQLPEFFIKFISCRQAVFLFPEVQISPMIIVQGSQKFFLNLFSELLGGNYFNIRHVAENVKDQLTGITVGQTQLIGAILQPATLLVGMPLLGGNPAGAFGGKSKGGGLIRRTGKDAKGLGEIVLQ
jgi:hypothetical protein